MQRKDLFVSLLEKPHRTMARYVPEEAVAVVGSEPIVGSLA
jgi:hypothetical protein